jgi:hypothetical protein
MTDPWKLTAYLGGISAYLMIMADVFWTLLPVTPRDSVMAIRLVAMACNLIAGLCMGVFLYRTTMSVDRGRRDGRASPAVACRNPRGDSVEFRASDESYYVRWIDARPEVYVGQDSGRIVGCRIGGVSAIEGGGSG